MKSDSTSGTGIGDKASAFMILDIAAEVLRNAEDPEKVGNEVTRKLRELTGAQTVLLLQHMEEFGGDGNQVVAVSPSRNRDLAQSTDALRLSELACDLEKPTLWRKQGGPEKAQQILVRMNYGDSIAIPLKVGEVKVGSLLLLDIPEDERAIPLILQTIDMLSVTLALILRNSLLFRQQEEIVAQRTRELTSSNQALHESEKKFRSLFEQAGDYILLLELTENKGLVIADANQAACKIHGYTSEEFLGTPIRDLDKGLDEEQMRPLLERIMSGESILFETAHVKKDGTIFPVEVSSSLLDIGADPPLIISIERDITKRQRREEQAARFSRVLEGSLNEIYIFDAETLRFIEVNCGARENLGYSMEELRALMAVDIKPEVTPEAFAELVEPLRSGDKETILFNTVHRRKDGSEYPVEVHLQLMAEGAPVFVAIILDITERQRAEKTLQSLVKSTVGVTGAECFHEIASEMCKCLGVDCAVVGEIVDRGGDGKTAHALAMIIDGKEISGYEYSLKGTPCESVINKGYCIYSQDIRDLFPHDRDLIDMNAEGYVGTPIRNRADEPVGILCAISRSRIEERKEWKSVMEILATRASAELERKYAEQERKKLEQQYRQAQKMEAVGQLAGGVAHDFNNLLQAILGYGEMALDDAGAESPIGESIEEVLKAGNRATTLVRQLLAFSRRQVLEMKNIDLNDLIADLMKMVRRVIGEHITLDFIPGHNLGIIRADPGQIEQILMNLCVNARDAMPEGGRITIETENVRIDEGYCETHSWAEPGRYALLSVTDTGCGMKRETLDKVFEPFFTTKGVGEGTGLGLATVYGLVKQHEGMVQVYSEVNKGTTFKIYLPLVERSAATVGDKIEGPVLGGIETILLAEDDTTLLQLSKAFLERAGYTVLTAVDGEEALRVFEEHADVIDLALLDVMMPKLGGKAVFEQIRAQRPQMRMLFASGYSMNAIHTNFVLDEGLTLIQKPCQRDDLLRKVREVLDSES